MSEYEPGTLWKAKGFDQPLLRGTNTFMTVGNLHYYESDLIDLRPLIVLDPEELGLDGNDVDRLRRGVTVDASGSAEAVLNAVADQIEAARPAPLAEPEAVGSVVYDQQGEPWTRMKNPDNPGMCWAWAGERRPWHSLTQRYGPLSLTPPDAPAGRESTERES